VNSKVEEYRYLLIGGAPKAGTTSLYRWLCSHPQICGSSLKETRFFLDTDNRLPSNNRFSGSNLQDYAAFFCDCPAGQDVLRMDATPDYLYSHSALQIADLLPRSKILFIIRDPVDRLVSWYKFALQRNFIDESMSFPDYVDAQVGLAVGPDTPIHLQALSQCCYEKYLPNFRAAFGSRCLEIDFRELKHNPGAIVSRICTFFGLDDEVYQDYDFRIENQSVTYNNGRMVSLYSSVRRAVAQALHASPVTARVLRAPNRIIKNLLTGTAAPAASVHVTDEVAVTIRNEIERIVNSKVPSESEPDRQGEF